MKAYMATPAGDGFINVARNLNPFKRKSQPPVAFWSGILEADLDEREVTFDIPSYFNGTLRVIGAASSLDAIGTSKADLLVQSDLIINPNLPLFVAPNDEFTVPVTIFNNLKDSGNSQVFLNIETSEGLKILDYPKEIPIDENKEATINVKLKATDKLGSADLRLSASINHLKPGIISMTVVHSSPSDLLSRCHRQYCCGVELPAWFVLCRSHEALSRRPVNALCVIILKAGIQKKAKCHPVALPIVPDIFLKISMSSPQKRGSILKNL